MTNQERIINEIKREAKHRRKTYGTKHNIALDEISKELGYQNYKDLKTKNN